jgi:DNA-directed RNA polymerase specialized sigma24 family protein
MEPGTELDSLLNGYRAALVKMAFEVSNRSDLVQDLAQEGHIAMWKAAQQGTPAGVKQSTYLLNQARWRMKRCLERHTWTGMEDRRTSGYGGTAKRLYADDVEQGMPTDAEDMCRADNDVEMFILSYHHGEIMSAINKLTMSQREKVFRRFWRGENVTGGWWYGPHGAKEKLATELAHLKGIC